MTADDTGMQREYARLVAGERASFEGVADELSAVCMDALADAAASGGRRLTVHPEDVRAAIGVVLGRLIEVERDRGATW